MKKILLIVFIANILGVTSKAQCLGSVSFDVSVNANGLDTFNITTANPNELILISCDGWPGPGSGTVTVDGNPATNVVSVWDGNNSAVAAVYAYSASLTGAHTIICSVFSSPYNANFAAAFYSSGSCVPINIANLTYVKKTLTCATGGSLTDTINSDAPNEMIYCAAAYNEGASSPYPISWLGANLLNDIHRGDGIDGSDAYINASIVGPYVATDTNLSPPGNGCGGLAMAMVLIKPAPLCNAITMNTSIIKNEICNSGCNGVASVSPTNGIPPYTYSWSPSGETTDTANGLCAGNYTVTITDSAGCSGSALVAITQPAAQSTPSLCYVTADTLSQHNVVVWQKAGIDTNTIDSIEIYRKGVSAYTKIGEVSIHAHTKYIDTTSSVDVESYFYEIGYGDSCYRSLISPYHQTVFLQSSLGIGNKVNLLWNFYVGVPVNYYLIDRDDSGTDKWHVIDSVSSANSAYTDTAAPLNINLRYRLVLNANITCSPYLSEIGPESGNRLASNTYDEIYSNDVKPVITGLASLGDLSNEVEIYPNPVKDELILAFKNKTGVNIKLFNMLGEKVIEQKISVKGDEEKLDLHSLEQGVYILEIVSDKGVYQKKIIKL